MNIRANSLIAQHNLDLLQVYLSAGDTDTEVVMELTWGEETASIGKLQTITRDVLCEYLTRLQAMHRFRQWDATASIICIQWIGYDEVESVRIDVGLTLIPTNAEGRTRVGEPIPIP